ncbi:MAG: hypothetical protein R3330_13230, partial [Saprospiraceae bacterium]|nr:hypothetical protein [Saprospiraceae bacterium]
ISFDGSFGTWLKVGTGLPNAPVWDLDYDLTDDVLVAGTLGRGAWTIDLSTVAIIEADLSITKADSSDPVASGGTLMYTLTVTNNGPDTAEDVQVTDTLPAGVSYVSDDSGCIHVAGVVTCDLGDMANGATQTIKITVKVDDDLIATILNTAAVASTTDDPDTSNNTDTEETHVLAGCGGLFATITGTPGSDNILGTPGADVIVTLAGRDNIWSLGGNDVICSGSDNDNIRSGAGNDVINAGSGNDNIWSEAGDDQVDGGPGFDNIFGGPGTDTCVNGEQVFQCE